MKSKKNNIPPKSNSVVKIIKDHTLEGEHRVATLKGPPDITIRHTEMFLYFGFSLRNILPRCARLTSAAIYRNGVNTDEAKNRHLTLKSIKIVKRHLFPLDDLPIRNIL